MIYFAIATKGVKNLGINLTKYVKDLYTEYYKASLKKILKTMKWKDSSCLWNGIISIVKITISPKAIYRFKAITIKISMMFLKEIEQNIISLYGTMKDLEKQKQSWGEKMKPEVSQYLTSNCTTEQR